MIDRIFARLTSFLAGLESEWLVLVLAFLAAITLFLFLAFLILPRLETHRRVRQELLKKSLNSRSLLAEHEGERTRALLPLQAYFESVENEEDKNSIRARLHRAGYYSRNAIYGFYVVRVALWLGSFAVAFIIGRIFAPGFPIELLFALCFVYSLLFLMLPNFILDRMGRKQEQSYRRAFPDFMDLMVVCADAGLSLEAAIEEVAEEMASTSSSLGLHLKIMTLEMRAGRPMREALHNLARRINIEEARALAVLFSQSEELGTSLTNALRVYSAEMRDKRITAAEEKANALPVKMVFPLGFCVFPVILVMILAPVFIRLSGIIF